MHVLSDDSCCKVFPYLKFSEKGGGLGHLGVFGGRGGGVSLFFGLVDLSKGLVMQRLEVVGSYVG